MLNKKVIRFDPFEAEPDARRPIVRGHPDSPRVMPYLPVDRLSERQTAMAAYDTVDPSLSDLFEFDCGRGGCKNEAVDHVDAAGENGKSTPTDFNVDPPRQICHPRPRVVIKLARSIGKPCGRQPLAAASCWKPATAVVGTGRKALLAIAHHHMANPVANQINSRRSICPIGHHIAGANDAIGRNRNPRWLFQEVPGGFEIAVRAPEHHQGLVHSKERNWSRHKAFARPVLGHDSRSFPL